MPARIEASNLDGPEALGPTGVNPSRPFILRPVATSLLMVAILLVALVSLLQLPISALPQVDYPTVQVLTFYPGASPEVTSTTVTAPLDVAARPVAEPEFARVQVLSNASTPAIVKMY